MNFINLLLDATDLDPNKFYGGYAWLNDVYAVLPTILYVILACVGGAGTVYAIILGVNLAKAESEDARKKATERLKNTIVGVAVLLILVLFINLFLPMILHAVLPGQKDPNAKPAMINALKMLLKINL